MELGGARGEGASSGEGALRDELTELRRLVNEQADRLDRQQTELDGLRRRIAADPSAGPPPTADERATDGTESPSRRQLLRRAGMVAAGTVAGAAALAVNAPPAAAADGDPILAGGSTSATDWTSLSYNVPVFDPMKAGFVVTEGSFFPDRAAMIYGNTSANAYDAVYGFANRADGDGVRGRGGRYGVRAEGTLADLSLKSGGSRTASTQHQPGELFFDANFDLWFSVTADAPGTPAKWKKVAGQSTTGSLHALTAPSRIYDSRPGTPQTGSTINHTPMGPGEQRSILVGAPTIPSACNALLVNLTVTNTNNAGFLGLYRGDLGAWPGNSSINWERSGQTVANGTLVTVSPAVSGTIKAYCNLGCTTDFLIDVLGYYQ